MSLSIRFQKTGPLYLRSFLLISSLLAGTTKSKLVAALVWRMCASLTSLKCLQVVSGGAHELLCTYIPWSSCAVCPLTYLVVALDAFLMCVFYISFSISSHRHRFVVSGVHLYRIWSSSHIPTLRKYSPTEKAITRSLPNTFPSLSRNLSGLKS